MNTSPAPAALFAATDLTPSRTPVPGASGQPRDPAPSDATLAGDGYGWLAALLPAPQAPPCGTCGQVMRLPAGAPVVWACPACHPEEAA